MSRTRSFIFALTTLSLWCAVPSFAEQENAISQAHVSYEQGKYEEAASFYLKAVESGLNNGHVLYDLANAEYRLGHVGRAILYYRRALLEFPRDPDIQSNLRLARQKVADRISEPENAGRLLTSSAFLLNGQLSHAEMVATLGYISAFLCLTIILSGIRPELVGNKIIIGSAAIVLLFGFLTYGVTPGRTGEPRLAAFSGDEPSDPAVVTASELKVYSGNSESYQVIFVLHDGAEVIAGETRDQWQEILLPDGKRGWTKRDGLEKV